MVMKKIAMPWSLVVFIQIVCSYSVPKAGNRRAFDETNPETPGQNDFNHFLTLLERVRSAQESLKTVETSLVETMKITTSMETVAEIMNETTSKETNSSKSNESDTIDLRRPSEHIKMVQASLKTLDASLVDHMVEKVMSMETRISRLKKSGKKFVLLGDDDVAHKQTWRFSRAVCEEKGGDLAVNLTKADLWFIFEKVVPKSVDGQFDDIWVGGRMNPRATEANFTESYEWVDGTPISVDDSIWKDFRGYRHLSDKCLLIDNETWRSKDNDEKGPAIAPYECPYSFLFLCELSEDHAVDQDL